MPISISDRRKLKRTIDKIVKDNIKLDKDSANNFLKLLKDTRRRINLEIIEAEGWDATWLTRIKSSIDEHIIRFRERLTGDLQDTNLKSWLQGISTVDKPLEVAKVTVGIPAVSESQLVAMQANTTELISGLSGDMRSKVRVALDQAILGEVSPYKTSKRINSILEVTGNRGETIVRTEVGRVFSVAGQIRKEQAHEVIPKLKKQWITSIEERTRPGHMAANNQVREVDEPFDVPNDRTGGIDKMMYPRDPAAPGEQVANCRCDSIPYMEEWE